MTFALIAVAVVGPLLAFAVGYIRGHAAGTAEGAHHAKTALEGYIAHLEGVNSDLHAKVDDAFDLGRLIGPEVGS